MYYLNESFKPSFSVNICLSEGLKLSFAQMKVSKATLGANASFKPSFLAFFCKYGKLRKIKFFYLQLTNVKF